MMFDADLDATRLAAMQTLERTGWVVDTGSTEFVVRAHKDNPTQGEIEQIVHPFYATRKRLEWEGATPETASDGGTVIRAQDGTSYSEAPDGTVYARPQADGPVYWRTLDGTLVEYYPEDAPIPLHLHGMLKSRVNVVRMQIDRIELQVWFERTGEFQTRVSFLFAGDWIIPEMEKSLGGSHRVD